MNFLVVMNLSSLSAQSTLSNTHATLGKTLERLTSGLGINTSADDAAGMALANRHRLDSTSLTVGTRNANDAISQLQIQDVNNISFLVGRATALAGQDASDTFTGDRSALDAEFQSGIRHPRTVI